MRKTVKQIFSGHTHKVLQLFRALQTSDVDRICELFICHFFPDIQLVNIKRISICFSQTVQRNNDIYMHHLLS